MNRVSVKDLALVAAAGGLLAFELVSIGEALPNVKKAFAGRAWPERAEVASASVAGVPLPAAESPAPTMSPAPMASLAPMESLAPIASPARVKASKPHASMVTVSTSSSSKDCVAIRAARRAHGRVRVVRVTTDGSCAVCAAAQAVEKRREIEKAVNLAVRQSTL